MKYIISQQVTGKYIITYKGGEYDGLIEFYADDLSNPITVIRYGYTKGIDSL